jgi:CheY-like chemotaxis protein
MAVTGPIIIIEDDQDDQEFITGVFKNLEITNELRFFRNGEEALNYLRITTDQPLLILCDVNMPGINGLEFREAINSDEYLRRKSIPFIFLSTSAASYAVRQAYDLNVQGFFQKQNSLQDLQSLVKLIIDYWKTCKHPNSPE